MNGFVDGVVTEEGTIALNVTGENMGVVIGRRGDTLDALQYITSIVVNRGGKEHVRVTVDTENYRKSVKNLWRRWRIRLQARFEV